MNKKILVLIAVLIIVALPLTVAAHGGRTDSNGGHKDKKNVSGLGSYHYHHGMEAHLHPNGECPYNKKSTKADTSVEKKPTSLPKATPVPTQTPTPTPTPTPVPTPTPTPKTIEAKDIEFSFVNRIGLNDNIKLDAKIIPEDTKDKSIIWSVDDESYATIENNVLKPLKSGKVTVMAKTSNGLTKTAEIEIYSDSKGGIIATTILIGGAGGLGYYLYKKKRQ